MKIQNLKLFKNAGLLASSVALAASLTSIPAIAYADEVEDNIKIENISDENLNGENNGEENVIKSESTQEGKTEENVLQAQQIPESEDTVNNESEKDEENVVTEEEKAEDQATEVGKGNEIHKVQTITTKVDENGDSLKGATLQILDLDGNVLDEWISDGEEHITMLPEGDYILHEKSAPQGYIKAEDKTFTIKVEVNELDAGVDFSETPCEHYGGTPLYYIEIESKKSEVYCINQDWETPDENSTYDGGILTSDDIKNYTQQTVYIDAHQNTALVDVSDQSLSSEELYDKMLDIIYHREKASSIFTDLTEAEIRYVTESALKNYTNAGLTRVQRVNVGSAPENYQSMDYYVTDDLKYVWYLYPWYRSFVYDPAQPLGKDIFTTVIGSGDAFGNLARHWSSGHNAKNSEEVRSQVARYYELYQYLISDNDHHPADMHLYIYRANNKATDLSGYNFDEGAYQNLLGITWYNPYDENVEMNITYVNEPQKPNITINPQTGDTIVFYFELLLISLMGIVIFAKLQFKKNRLYC